MVKKSSSKKQRRNKGKKQKISVITMPRKGSVGVAHRHLSESNALAAGVIRSGYKTKVSRALAHTLEAVLLPYDTPVPRIMTGAQHQVIQPIATAKNFTILNIDLATMNPNNYANKTPFYRGTYLWPLVDKSFNFIHFHDPYLLAIYPVDIPSNPNPPMYDCRDFMNAACGTWRNSFIFPVGAALNGYVLDKYLLEPSHFNRVSGDIRTYGAKHPCFQFDAKRRAFWVDANHVSGEAQIDVVITTDAHTSIFADSLQIYLTRIEEDLDEGRVTVMVVPATPVSTERGVTFTIETSGYYYVTLDGNLLVDAPGVSASFDVILEYRTACWRYSHHLTNPNINPNVTGTAEVRKAMSVGCSALATNTGAAGFKSGTVIGRILQSDEAWYNTVFKTDDDLTGINKSMVHLGDWERGVYSVCFPNQLRYTDVTRNYFEKNVCMSNPIVPTDLSYNGFIGANLVRITPGVSTTGSGAQTARITFTTTYNFTTESQNYVLARADIPPSIWEEASYKLSGVQRFYDNPFHWKDIGNAIQKAAGWVADTGKKVLEYAPSVTRLIGMGVDLASAIAML